MNAMLWIAGILITIGLLGGLGLLVVVLAERKKYNEERK